MNSKNLRRLLCKGENPRLRYLKLVQIHKRWRFRHVCNQLISKLLFVRVSFLTNGGIAWFSQFRNDFNGTDRRVVCPWCEIDLNLALSGRFNMVEGLHQGAGSSFLENIEFL
jgi:hypothetical protein